MGWGHRHCRTVYPGQIAHQPVHRPQWGRLWFWRSRLAGGGDAVGVLLGANIFDRRRVHLGLHQYVWLPARSTGARNTKTIKTIANYLYSTGAKGIFRCH